MTAETKIDEVEEVIVVPEAVVLPIEDALVPADVKTASKKQCRGAAGGQRPRRQRPRRRPPRRTQKRVCAEVDRNSASGPCHGRRTQIQL